MHSNSLPAAAVVSDQEVMAIGIAQAELSQLHEAWVGARSGAASAARRAVEQSRRLVKISR